jgi:hypothetical protein
MLRDEWDETCAALSKPTMLLSEKVRDFAAITEEIASF